MSSATSAVTYTSVYTDSEPGRAFWGTDDEEVSEGGIPRVIVLGYDGLPLQPVAPPSPDYIPGPENPQTPPVPPDDGYGCVSLCSCRHTIPTTCHVQSMSSSVTPVRRYGNPASGYESYMLAVHSELPNSTQQNVPKPLGKPGPPDPTVVQSHSETVYLRPIH
ncbi:hypothetical protein Tco_0066235 [Tanacetum coccineum]